MKNFKKCREQDKRGNTLEIILEYIYPGFFHLLFVRQEKPIKISVKTPNNKVSWNEVVL